MLALYYYYSYKFKKYDNPVIDFNYLYNTRIKNALKLIFRMKNLLKYAKLNGILWTIILVTLSWLICCDNCKTVGIKYINFMYIIISNWIYKIELKTRIIRYSYFFLLFFFFRNVSIRINLLLTSFIFTFKHDIMLFKYLRINIFLFLYIMNIIRKAYISWDKYSFMRKILILWQNECLFINARVCVVKILMVQKN